MKWGGPGVEGYQPLDRESCAGPAVSVTIPSNKEGTAEQMLAECASCTIDEVFHKFKTSPDGLTSHEAQRRLQAWGPNVIASSHAPPWYSVLWTALVHPFNCILVFLGVTASLTDDVATGVIMGVMVTVSTALRFWQELKSTVAAARLLELIHTRAKVVRRDQHGVPAEVEVEQADVVPGDVVKLFAGEMFPGDVRLVTGKDLFVGEATLTGESLPVEKQAAPCSPGTPLLDSASLGFMGTHVVSGVGLGVVVATGGGTYLSTMAAVMAQGRPPNAFQTGVRRVSLLLIAFMAAMVPVVVAISAHMTGDWYQAALFGISVAVGLTPEMLPMVVNANLARGAVALARQRAIVKRLEAVQNLGAMDVLCTDKTGTLTVNEVVLMRWMDSRGEESREVLRWGFLNSYFQTGIRNLLDNAILEQGRGAGVESESGEFEKIDELPFDFVRRRLSVVLQHSGAALLVCKGALEEVLALCTHVQQGGRVAPLEGSDRQRLAALGEGLNVDGLRVLAVGVKEIESTHKALSMAGTPRGGFQCGEVDPGPSTPPTSPAWEGGRGREGILLAASTPPAGHQERGEKEEGGGGGAVADEDLEAGRGQDVEDVHAAAVAAASGGDSDGAGRWGAWGEGGCAASFGAEDEAGMTFVGFLAFLDPPKETASQAVRELHDKAVGVKVLTGDSLQVTVRVCDQVGIPTRHVITGPELEKLGGGGAPRFAAEVERATVMAKLTPLQKKQVVESLQRGGHTVGFLGDGINDTLALRCADVGVSVDDGTDIAKDAADVILLEKSLMVLEHGVMQGRVTHGNTVKYIKMAASSNFGNVLSILVASAWLPFQPMKPIQLLTQNLLYDASQVAIPFDTMDADYLARPRTWSARGIGLFMVCIGPTSSLFDITTFALLWFFYSANTLSRQSLFQTGWFTVGLLTQTLIVHMIRTQRVPFLQEVAAPPVLLATVLVSAAGLALPYTPVGRVEGMVGLPATFYGFTLVTVLAYCLTVQLAKVAFIRAFKTWL